MYSKKDIEKELIEYNYFIDETTLGNFIKNWKIDAIYEDEDGVEFFDNLSIAKLKKGISLKSQGYTNEQIIYHINKLLPEKMGVAKVEDTNKPEISEVKEKPVAGLKNVTIDVTHQTLQMLATSIAEKITSEISGQIKDSDFARQLLEDSSLKDDNKKLAKKVEELTDDNKKLAQRIEELEKAPKGLLGVLSKIFK